MAVIKQIMVPTDFSQIAADALDYAKTLAEAVKASLHIVHILQEPKPVMFGEYVPLEEYWEAVEKSAREAIGRVLKESEREKFHATLWVGRGFPPDQIVKYAEQHAIDLIVMGTHGRSPVTRLLLGSVADRVIRKARCPVLTVHPREDKEIKKI